MATEAPTHCKECNAPVAQAERRGPRVREFCGSACRSTFNNRRAMRGAILLDLMMTDYTDRKSELRKNGTIQKVVRRLLSRWRDQDRKANRAHCMDPSAFIAADMTLTMDAIHSTRNAWSAGA